MFRNYIKIAWRSLNKNRLFTVINIFGLALGFAVAIFIGLWIVDEFDYNNHYKNKDRIAQVMQHQTINGEVRSNESIPSALEFQLRENFKKEFDYVVMSSGSNSRNLSFDEKVISTQGRFMQAEAPDFLDLKMIKGTKEGLSEINSIFISETTAKKLFGEENPIGKQLVSNNEYNMVVKGVYKDIPKNNSFHNLHFLMPLEHWISSRWSWLENPYNNWDYNSFDLFVMLSQNVELNILNTKIENVKKNNDPKGDKFNPRLFVFPMEDWYLRSNFENGIQTGGRIDIIKLFTIIGFFVLLLACINFMNLSTARSGKRALEVGIRKSIGSTRKQLVYQFLSETFLVVLFSFVISIALISSTLHFFNQIAGKTVEFPWHSSWFWVTSLIFIFLTTILAGSYPAFFLSGFKPVKVLKGILKTNKSELPIRKVLVVIQFVISITLIIGTLLVKQQIDFAKDRSLGFEKDQLIKIPTFSKDFAEKFEFVQNEFIKSGAIENMGWGTSPSTKIWNKASGYDWDGKPQGFDESFAIMAVSFDYIQTLKMNVIEGRSFSRNFATDSNAVILNKTAVNYMGITNPIGKYIRYSEPEEANNKPLKIIGVVDDVINQSAYKSIYPQMYEFGYGYGGFYQLCLNKDRLIRENLNTIEKIFKANFPNVPFSYQFVDEEYALMFAEEDRIKNLSGIFAGLTILISCLGLFGLASYVAEKRTKEIGVRKVLGASVSQLWVLLSKEFLALVVISLTIAVPIAFYVMNQWLQKFSYRTTVTWEVFAFAILITIFISILTVSFKTLKAAIANPVNSLRSE